MLFQRKDIIRAANNLVADFWKGGRSRDREKSRLLQPRLGNSLEMTFHLGIYCGASELIREYGEDAAVEAAERANTMLKNGLPGAAAVWTDISRMAAFLTCDHSTMPQQAEPSLVPAEGVVGTQDRA